MRQHSGNDTAIVGSRAPVPPVPVISLPNLWQSLKRQRRWILLTPVVTVLVVAIITSMLTPKYESTATLLFDGEKSRGQLLSERVAALAGLGGGGTGRSLQTDLVVLQSRQVVEAVVDSLAYRVSVIEPRRPRSRVLSHVAAPGDGFVGEFTFVRAGPDRYVVSAETAAGEPVDVGGPVRPGEMFRFAELELELNPGLLDEPVEKIRVQVVSQRAAVSNLLKVLEVETVERSNVVAIKFRDTDPVVAAGVPNRMSAEFIAFQQRTNRVASRGAVDFLREQAALYKTHLEDAEARLQKFLEGTDPLSLPEATPGRIQRMSALEIRRAELDSERGVLAQLLHDAEAGQGGSATYRKLAAFPEFFRNPAVQDILGALVQLENRRSELLVRRTPENLDVRGLTERIEELERQLRRIAVDYLDGLDKQIAATDSMLGREGREASRIPAREVELIRLRREAKLFEEIYTHLEKQLKSEEVAEADARTHVQVLDAALVPTRPVSPRPKLNLILGLLVGSILGVGIAGVRAVLDPRLHTRDAFILAAGGAPLLGVIPAARSAGNSSRSRGLGALMGRRTEARLGTPAPRGSTRGPRDEAIRALRTRLVPAPIESAQVVLVSSVAPGMDGAMVAEHLAESFARQGTRTLYVDADFVGTGRLPTMGRSDGGPGLSDVLAGRCEFEDVVQRRPVEGGGASLDLLSSGTDADLPPEVLGSPRMFELLDSLRSSYQVVVIDAAPFAACADAALLGERADVVLLVAEVGATGRRLLEEVADRVRDTGARRYGLVLTGADVAWKD